MLHFPQKPTCKIKSLSEYFTRWSYSHLVFGQIKPAHFYSVFNDFRLVELCAAKTPATLKQFAVVFQAAGLPDICTESVPFSRLKLPTNHSDYDPKYAVPSFGDLGKRTLFHGCVADFDRRYMYNTCGPSSYLDPGSRCKLS